MLINLSIFSAGDSARRKGMNKKPKFKYLDPSDVWAILHLWIRLLYFFWNIFQHLNARDAFPKRIPTMRGQKKGPIIIAAVEAARQALIKKAKKKPISMYIDCPDPHGKYFSKYVQCVAVQTCTK